MKIALGPLLGIESDYFYSVCFLSSVEFSTGSLKLEISYPQGSKPIIIAPVLQENLRSHIFYRFSFELPASVGSYNVGYRLTVLEQGLFDNHNRNHWEFKVAGRKEIPSIAFASCNDDSKEYPSNVDGEKYREWKKMRLRHCESGNPFHLMLLGGDQIYADTLWDKVETIHQLKSKSWLGRSKLVFNSVRDKRFNRVESVRLTEELQD